MTIGRENIAQQYVHTVVIIIISTGASLEYARFVSTNAGWWVNQISTEEGGGIRVLTT